MPDADASPVFERSWARLWPALGISAPPAQLRPDLLAHYAEPQRRYHTQQHLQECLEQFEPVAGLATNPGEVEVALWFHDAIYQPQRGDNEAASARWADEALTAAGVSTAARARVERMILATRHDGSAQTDDERLLLDIDLSILGAAPARFAEYEAQIRAEYGFVPEPLFRAKRGEILRGFLSRPRLFATEHFHAQREATARDNLRRALATLEDVPAATAAVRA